MPTTGPIRQGLRNNRIRFQPLRATMAEWRPDSPVYATSMGADVSRVFPLR